MRYKITRNGEVILVTNSLRHASAVYNKTIYVSKQGDIIRVYYRKDPTLPWENIRKDWL